MDEEIEEAFLKIVHVKSNALVAVIEVVVPRTRMPRVGRAEEFQAETARDLEVAEPLGANRFAAQGGPFVNLARG